MNAKSDRPDFIEVAIFSGGWLPARCGLFCLSAADGTMVLVAPGNLCGRRCRAVHLAFPARVPAHGEIGRSYEFNYRVGANE